MHRCACISGGSGSASSRFETLLDVRSQQHTLDLSSAAWYLSLVNARPMSMLCWQLWCVHCISMCVLDAGSPANLDMPVAVLGPLARCRFHHSPMLSACTDMCSRGLAHSSAAACSSWNRCSRLPAAAGNRKCQAERQVRRGVHVCTAFVTRLFCVAYHHVASTASSAQLVPQLQALQQASVVPT